MKSFPSTDAWWPRVNGVTTTFPVTAIQLSFPFFGVPRRRRFTGSEKRVDPRSRKSLYLVIGLDGRIIRRGHELRAVLGVFDQKLLRIVA